MLLWASSPSLLISIVPTPHRHDEHSKCRVGGAMRSPECQKVEKPDVASFTIA
ncbi:MAG: hypothetical protein KME22_26960 [Hassallia sp. WJT32-NPBG1]|nr:hypothetical protein [Hassallia sp. WJT32-NPBG1]